MTDGSNGPTEYFYLGNKLVAKESQVQTSEDTPGYTGHLEDDDLQLTYMQQRYYDPLLGRFYSNDPVGFSPSNPMLFNRYAYANNNPYRFIDPDGRNPRRAVMAVLKDPVRSARQAGRAIGDGLRQIGVLPPAPMRNESASDEIDIPIGSEDKPQLAPEGGTIFVDSSGNALVGPEGSTIEGSPDGKYTQVKDKEGNATGVRKDGGHSPRTHDDPRALEPHGHVPGVTNEDGTPWLPLK